jgi:hypothetical protein
VFHISLGTPVSGLTKVVDSFDQFAKAGCMSAYGERFDNIISKVGIIIRLGRKTLHAKGTGFIVEGYSMAKGDRSKFTRIGLRVQTVKAADTRLRLLIPRLLH